MDLLRRLLPALLVLLPVAASAQEGTTPEDLSRSIVFVPVKGDITPRLCDRVARDIRECVERRARKIVLEIDTEGGDYLAASALAGTIYELRSLSPRVETFAYIPNSAWAISAGALIAIACENLVMGDNSHIGDVEPRDGLLNRRLDEKAQTVVRNDLVRYAKEHAGWPLPLVEAMVTREIVVYEVIDRSSGGARPRYLRQEDVDALPAAERDRLEKRVIDGAGELVTLDDREALEFGFIEKIYPTRNAFLVHQGISEYPVEIGDALGRNVSIGRTGPLAWLSDHPFPAFVKFILILVGVVGLVVELKMPGFGVGGTLFLLCFSAFFVEGFATGYVGWAELICFPLAIVLLAVEMFALPGFGVAGASGLALLLASLGLALMPESEKLTWSGFSDQLLVVLGALASSVVVTVLVLRFLPGGRAREGGGLISTTSLSGDARIAESGADPTEAPGSLVGRRGAVVSALRPAGKAEIGGVLRDVVAVGEFLDPGTPIEVVEVEGNRIVVRSLPGSPGPGAPAGGPLPGAGG